MGADESDPADLLDVADGHARKFVLLYCTNL
jgi:hypothetical protein